MTSLNEFGQHTWHYVFNNEAKTEVTFNNHCVFCDEVVREFACYLMATGLCQTSIIQSFEDYVDEYKQSLIKAVKRLDDKEDDRYNVFSTMVGEGE